MSRTAWRRVRLLAGVVLLAVIGWRLGTGPWIDGLADVTPASLLVAGLIALLTTLGCAVRWCLVARALGDLELGQNQGVWRASAEYYRSQFLNTALPGGVLGDVHRGVRRGQDVADVGLGLRVVVWERAIGQFVQIVLTILAVLFLPSPIHFLRAANGLWAMLFGSMVLISVPLVLRRYAPGLLEPRVGLTVLSSSVIVVAGHVATFIVAARVAGSTASVTRLVPLALIVLLAMSLPINIGGWGPREGVAAWLFGLAGLGAGLGLAAAVAYGVMVLVANLPGAGVVLLDWRRRAGVPEAAPDESRAAVPEAAPDESRAAVAVGQAARAVHG